MRAKFKGKLRLENLQPPHGYTLPFEGRGGELGPIDSRLADMASRKMAGAFF